MIDFVKLIHVGLRRPFAIAMRPRLLGQYTIAFVYKYEICLDLIAFCGCVECCSACNKARIVS